MIHEKSVPAGGRKERWSVNASVDGFGLSARDAMGNSTVAAPPSTGRTRSPAMSIVGFGRRRAVPRRDHRELMAVEKSLNRAAQQQI